MSELGHLESSSAASSGAVSSGAATSGAASSGAQTTVHRKEAGGEPGTGGMAAAAGGQGPRHTDGAAREPGMRNKMEGAFGADFSSVRVHTDGAAGAAAKDLNAHAFATGSDIFFDQGKYEPGAEGGDRLIAHELAHVVQTGGSGGGPA